jgi:diguanylate cyclase (GGDEF)-like protein
VAGHDARPSDRTVYTRAAVVACLVFLLWLVLPGRPTLAKHAVSDVFFVLAPAAGAWRCLRAARRPGVWGRCWTLFGVGCAAWVVSSTWWAVHELGPGPSSPFPPFAGLGWLLFALLAICALATMPGMPRRAVPAGRLLLDALAAAASLLTLAWLGPLGDANAAGGHSWAHILGVVGLVLDVLAAAVVVVVLSRLRGGVRQPGVVAALSVVLVSGTGALYAYLSSHGHYTPGGALDLVWVAAFLLLGFAADLPEPVARDARNGHLMPALPAGVAIGVLLLSGRLSDGLEPMLVGSVVVLGASLAARQHLLAAENRALHQSLEHRVSSRTAELREAQEVYRHRAYTDPLTGLANRDSFNEALTVAVASTDGTYVGIVLLDLDGFKRVNDSFGHDSGDEVLVAVADRLRSCLRRSDTEDQVITRLGGDEFACLLRGLSRPQDADMVAERLVNAMRDSVIVDSHEFFLGASAGVAVTGTPMSRRPSELLREADTAMYVAKDAGGSRFRTFDNHMHSTVVERVALEADLHRALAEGEIRVHYQPIVALDQNRITGVEALARWHHPVRGDVSPAEFIPAAERTGLIIELERQVLEQVCGQMARWRREVPDLKVGVNFSTRHLREPDVVGSILACLQRHDLPPSMLVAEVTESLFFTNEDVVSDVLEALDAAGILLALDDFGTGYSSLSRLSQHPFRILKVDQSFLADVGTNDTAPTILLATLAIAKGLGLDVVAEGVETQAQLDFLVDQGCPFAQGYLLARPTAPENIAALLREALPLAI